MTKAVRRKNAPNQPPRDVFAPRRGKLARALDGCVGLLFAGDAAPSLDHPFRADSSFAYFTGLSGEPGAVLLVDPVSEDPARREILFLKPRNPEVEAWDGYRDELDSRLKSRLGFPTILRTTHLPRTLTALARRRKRLACLHPFAVYDAPASPDLSVFRKVMERVPLCQLTDHTDLVPSMRAIKEPGEVDAIRDAIRCTALGLGSLLDALRPGVNEGDLQRAFESGSLAAGGEGNAYRPIVGSGLQGTVLHYHANNRVVGEDDLVVVDAGARARGYCADITRTYPASGRFSKRQRFVYDAVLEAQLAAIDAVRPGRWLHEVDAAARAVLEHAGLLDHYLHGIGHQLGLEVHDPAPDGPLRAGMVITIEPGAYLKDEALGVRIEDDVLVTARGHENLSSSIPKSPGDIEQRPGRAGTRIIPARRARSPR